MSYGSLENLLHGQGRYRYPEPEVGMGATEILYSDRHAGTIVATKAVRGKVVRVDWTRDEAIRVDENGRSESQSYCYKLDPFAPIEVFTLRKNGAWVKAGQSMRNGRRLAIGKRDEFYDYSF